MPDRGVKARGFDLVLRDLVREGSECDAATSEIRRSVDTPLVLAQAQWRKESRGSADLPLRQVLRGSLVYDPWRDARHQHNVIRDNRQVRKFARGQRLSHADGAGVEN